MKKNIFSILLGLIVIQLFGCGSNISSSMGASIVNPTPSGGGVGDTTWSSVLLTNITLSDGTLNPGFSQDVVAYTTQVPNTTGSITITPIAEDPYAQITIEGQILSTGQTSNPIALVANVPRTINIVVRSGNVGEQKTYSVTVTREPSNNANLSNLTLNNATIAPVFSSSTIIYSSIVPFTTTLVSVTPVIAESTATLKVNNALINSGDNFPVNLTPGYNIINILVTAQNGIDTKTYTVVITLGNSDANIQSLDVVDQANIPINIAPTFDKDITTYIVQLLDTTTAIRVATVAADTYSEIKVNNVIVVSGFQSNNIDMLSGVNTITIHITSSDSSTQRTYTILAVKP